MGLDNQTVEEGEGGREGDLRLISSSEQKPETRLAGDARTGARVEGPAVCLLMSHVVGQEQRLVLGCFKQPVP